MQQADQATPVTHTAAPGNLPCAENADSYAIATETRESAGPRSPGAPCPATRTRAAGPEPIHVRALTGAALLQSLVLIPQFPAQAKALVADPGVSGRSHCCDLVAALAAKGAPLRARAGGDLLDQRDGCGDRPASVVQHPADVIDAEVADEDVRPGDLDVHLPAVCAAERACPRLGGTAATGPPATATPGRLHDLMDPLMAPIERSTEYWRLSIGCIARRALLMAFGVIARFTARPGCTARRTLRGTRSPVRKPMRSPSKPEMRGNSPHEWPPFGGRIPDDAALLAAPPFEPARRDASRAYVTVRIQATTRQLAGIDRLLADLHRGVRCPGQPIRQQKEPRPPWPPCPAN
jgi:hypothetical protein